MSKKSTKAAPKDVSTYSERDIVLGKVRGYPPWPGMIVDPDSVPDAVQAERPAKKANFYCVQFFPTGDYAWLVPKDISKLQTHEIESYINEPYKKSGDLLQGYRTALDPTAWEASRVARVAALAADEDAEAEAEVDDAEVDELDTDDEDKKKAAAAAAKSRKRKRESDAAAAPKTRKTPKEKKAAEGKEKKKTAAATKPRKSGAPKSRAMVESEDEHGAEEDAEGEDAGDKEKEEDPEDAKMQADPEAVKVREWRHRLQKAFLSNKTTPEDADMPALDALFSTVESYHAMSVAYLQFSKIGKVMRHITLLPEDRVPRDAEFRFRERARALVERWQLVLGAGRTEMKGQEVNGNGNGKEGKEEGKAGVNGAEVAAEDTKDTKEVTAGAAAIDLNANGHTHTEGGAVKAEQDVDAVGEAEAEAEAEADAQGHADAQGEVEVDAPAEVDVPMAEA
ncbi:putative PWWP domain containing protein [Lyophyllum shimeji]|uniref:PWWP domain containing protein n=1 Tax=Lyophyllum shimeji TaxID=47721 RepID=A0A9P3PXP3_LYOSH|nr:putative PWWP domain containing protein [Lyophyllum shimeji]